MSNGKIKRKPALVNKLIKDLRAVLTGCGLRDDPPLICAAAAVLGLARAALCPASVRPFLQPGFEELACMMALASGHSKKAGPLRLDTTEFGSKTTALVTPLLSHPHDQILQRLFAQLREIASDSQIATLVDDPLCTGWIYQALLKQQSSETRKNPDWRKRFRNGVSPAEIPHMTQWFTPDWIAQYLVAETIDALPEGITNERFLDPACGAGHILLPAFNMLVNKKRATGSTAEEAMKAVLSDQLYGLEIDGALSEHSSFALYLAARQQMTEAIPLPLPNIFTFTTRHDDKTRKNQNECWQQSAGSLWLGVDKPPDTLALDHFGTTIDLDRLPSVYSLIATNPPYLSHRLMPDPVSSFLKEHYPAAQYDLYAAFLSLSQRLLHENGRLAVICQQSFLTIQRYQKLRSELMESLTMRAIVQLGPGAFDAKSGEKANNAIIVWQKCRPGDNDVIRCWQLLDSNNKRLAQEAGLVNLPPTEVEAAHATALFSSVVSAPFTFWCPREISSLFQTCMQLESSETGLRCVNGLFTCDNKRFVKRYDELAESDLKDYAPYDKGGGYKWFHTTPYMVLWRENGAEIRRYRLERGQSASLPGEDFYFRSGVTYSYIGTKGFKARLLSRDSIFDIASSAIFSQSIDNLYIVGFLNSALARFMLGVLNPTINFQIGDLRRLPFVAPTRDVEDQVAGMAGEAIEIARQLETFFPRSKSFQGAALNRYCGKTNEERFARHMSYIEHCNRLEQDIQNRIDETIFDLYQISADTRSLVRQDPWVKRGHEQFCKAPTFKKCLQEQQETTPATFLYQT